MTNSELKLFVEALRWKVGYEDSNPDVGFGVSNEQHVQDIARQANMNLSVQELGAVIGLYSMMYGRR